ncbi:MAG: GNAT family N-acetyltransferase [Terriglobales bacterium]|jgi:CelD/BcsL family acetyltransferase involved in cellulose biosynthesis
MPLALTTCYRIDPLSDARWAALVESHPLGSVFHSPKWLRALREAYGYEPVVVTTCPPGAPLTNGLVFCKIKSRFTGRRFVSLPFSDHCEPLTDSPDELDAMLEDMKRQVSDEGWKYIEIRPVIYAPTSPVELIRGSTYLFHRMDLRPSAAELFRKFHKDCVQRKIRRAEREQLQYEEGTSEDLLRKFYRLQVLTRRRHCLPPQPLSWFRGIVAAFGGDVKIRVASKDGLPVAAMLTITHKKSMIYKYGCSNAAFHRFGGTALLFWKTIQDAKDHGLEELEMGRSDVDNQGLITYKERWGATRAVIRYWSYPPEPAGLPSVWKKTLARHLAPILPDIALETIGRLLYKHVG